MATSAQHERFLDLLDQHKKILYKIAHAYCWNDGDRADLVQEMVLQIWRSFERYDTQRKFSTWLYGVALNVAISFQRGESQRVKRTVAVDSTILEMTPDKIEEDRDDQLRLLQRFMAELDRFDRALLILYLNGNNYDEIAELLGISPSNAGTKINRIKGRLTTWVQTMDKENEHGT